MLQECGAISWLESDEKEQIASALAAVDQWLSSCRNSLATASTDPAVSLQELISQVKCPAIADFRTTVVLIIIILYLQLSFPSDVNEFGLAYTGLILYIVR